jgi:hypothetical protein
MGKAGDRISRARERGQAVLHIAVPGGGQASLIVERELALRLAERRMQAGTTFAEMVRAGDPDLAQLVLAHIAGLRAEHQGIDLGLARLAPAATLGSIATRRDPDITALDQGGVFRLSPRSNRARDWMAANVRNGKQDGVGVVVSRQQAARLIGAMQGAGLRVAAVY